MNELTQLQALWLRIQALASSMITKLSVLLAILVGVAQQLKGIEGIPTWLTQDLGSAIAVLGVVIFQVRNHTKVAQEDKGLLPPKGPGTMTITESGIAHRPDDAGQLEITVHIVLAIAGVVCGVLLFMFGVGAITFNGLVPWTIAGLGIIFASLAAVI